MSSVSCSNVCGDSACRAAPRSRSSVYGRNRSSPSGTASVSNTTMCRRLGRSSRTGCQRASSSAPARTAIGAELWSATYRIWSLLNVEYAVHGTAPRLAAARSVTMCSTRLGAMMSSRWPARRPRSANPRATAATWSRTCAQLRVGLSGSSREVRAGRSPNSVALRRRNLAMVWPSTWAATDC